ncbi:hypothetical protein [Streptomyces sp. NBC_01012]|uniref:hypothetical protein n=1 Tax=Streptomyces sp. NBC_01012 TaxID=2903717 RepID=UPI003866B644|nr:hypothetical protein OG623_06860 [Streptomyces sp. NBC_01012]
MSTSPIQRSVLPRPGRSRRARAAEHDRRALSDAARLLDDGLCPVCRRREEFATRWLSYFIIESHTEEGTRSRVRAAVGFCPAHTRRLLADASAPWLMPQVHSLALAGGTRLLDEPDARPARCPCCVAGDDAAERALGTLLGALGHPSVREAVRGGAVCLPHTAELAARAPQAYGRSLADAASGLLTKGRRDLVWLAGADEDAQVRAALFDRIDPLLREEEERRRRSVTSRWEADTEAGCCPLCRAEHRAVRRLLQWEAAASGHGRPASEESLLCTRHLHDVTAMGGPNVASVITENCARWNARIKRFQRLLDADGKRHSDAGRYLLSEPPCRACLEERTAVRRQTALLTAELRDPPLAQEYTHTHGVCLRHALNWQGPRPALVDEVLGGRLALLRWEIDEVLRKQDWRTRHEITGSERDVGRRAPTLLDGRVHGGSADPPGPSSAPGEAPVPPREQRRAGHAGLAARP